MIRISVLRNRKERRKGKRLMRGTVVIFVGKESQSKRIGHFIELQLGYDRKWMVNIGQQVIALCKE